MLVPDDKLKADEIRLPDSAARTIHVTITFSLDSPLSRCTSSL